MLELPEILAQAPLDSIRSFISELEVIMLGRGEQLDVPITHLFSKGVYAREMNLPEGSLIIGKIHKHPNMNILSSGEVTVFSEESGVRRLKAPYSFVAAPGAKRIIYAHTPVTWTTIHGTDEQDVDKIESQVIAKDYSEVVALEKEDKISLTIGAQKCLGS